MSRSTDDRDLLAAADWTLWPKAWKFVRPDWALYAVAFACAPASALLTIAQPWLLKKAIDEHVVTGDLADIRTVALAFLGAVIAAFVLEAFYTLAMSYGALKSITRLRRAVYEHTLAQSQAFFDIRPTGRLLTRVTSDRRATCEAFQATRYDIWVDFAFGGSEAGTFANPYNTITEGVNNLATPGVGASEIPNLYIKEGSTNWTGTIDKTMRISTCGGIVRIGV